MEQISGQSFTGSVETDGKTFVECTFANVDLIYRGTEHPLFERCQFLQRIANDDGGEKFIARLFAKGHYLAD